MRIISAKAREEDKDPKDEKPEEKETPTKDKKSEDKDEKMEEMSPEEIDKLPPAKLPASMFATKPEGTPEGNSIVEMVGSGIASEGGDREEIHIQFVLPDEILDQVDIAQLMQAVMQIGTMADENGLHQEANKFDNCLVALAEAAKYEGFKGFWYTNGRAFEKAYKAKIDSGKSPQDCWMEVLEEYQDYLLSGKDFCKKYASKKAIEEADGMGGGGSTTMSKDMSDRAKRIKEKADKEGKTEGQATVEWLEEESKNNKKAARVLLTKVASKLERGEEPGVAFYETMTELREHKKVAVRKAIDEINNFSERLAQSNWGWLRGLWDSAVHPFKSWWTKNYENLMDKAEDFKAKYKSNPVMDLKRAVERSLPVVQREMNDLWQRVNAGGGVANAEVKKIIDMAGFSQSLAEYLKYASKVVSVMPMPDPTKYGTNGIMTKVQFLNFYRDLNNVLKVVDNNVATEAAKLIQTNSPQQALPTPMDQSTPEDQGLEFAIRRSLQKMDNHLKLLILLSTKFNVPIHNSIFPAGVDAKIKTLNLQKMLNDTISKMNTEKDLGNASLQLSDRIISDLDNDFDNYIASLSSLTSYFTNNPSQTKALNMTYGPPKMHIDKLVAAWEKSKDQIEQSIQNALKGKFERLMSHRVGPVQQQQPVAR